MKKYSLISDVSDELFYADECIDLPQSLSTDNLFKPGFLLKITGLQNEKEKNHLPLNENLQLVKNINSKPIEIGYIQCNQLLATKNSEQIYLISPLKIDIKKIHILECFVENIKISFKDLDKSYAASWLSACCIFHFTFGHKGHLPNKIKLDVSSLKQIEEFYCYLGEILFGYAGYAGQDLDGCYEILSSQNAERKIFLIILNEDITKKFLTEATGQQNYYENFTAMITDVGGVITPA